MRFVWLYATKYKYNTIVNSEICWLYATTYIHLKTDIEGYISAKLYSYIHSIMWRENVLFVAERWRAAMEDPVASFYASVQVYNG